MNNAAFRQEQPLPPTTFGSLVSRRVLIPSERTNLVAVDKYFLVRLMQDQLRLIHLDEDWYFLKYPDIWDAFKSGKVRGARHHYVSDGYYEHRLPYQIMVDEPWYLERYPDVRTAVERQEFASAQIHFESAGYGEGRDPHEGFVLSSDLPEHA